MKNYLRVAVGVSIFSFIVSSVGAVTYPSTTPLFETASGAFNTYFYNMYSNTGTTDIVLDYTKGCPEGQVIRGFSTGGILYCINSVTSGLTGSIVGIDKYVPRYTTAGTGLTISQIYDSGTGVIIGYGTGASSSTNNTRLTLSGGDLDIDGIRVGRGKLGYAGNTIVGESAYLNPTAGYNNTILGYLAGNDQNTGDNNIAIGNNALLPNANGSDQLNIGNIIYGSGLTGGGSGSIGIGTNTPGAKLEIDSGIANTSGLKFTKLTSAAPDTMSQMKSLGVNGSGEVVAGTPLSNIAVYKGIDRDTPLPLDPDLLNKQIRYRFNNYFALPGDQSFVVSNGNKESNDGPYIQENGSIGLCSTSGSSSYDCIVPVDGLSASPKNTFTMNAKSANYGYQIALSARGDTPLLARSGRFNTSNVSTGGLFLADQTTHSPWQKVVSIPVNHIEYFFIDTGFDSQLNPTNGGGRVGIGTSKPASRFEVWTGATTTSLLHFRGLNNTAIGLGALSATPGSGSVTQYNNNTAVGYNAGSGLTTGSNNIMLGADTRAQSGDPSNTLNIGNTLFGINLPTIFGGTAGYIGIGTATPAKQLTITESMEMPDTTSSSAGVLYKGGSRFLHNFTNSTNNNTFLGLNSGNFGLTGTGNTAVGSDTLKNLSSGYSNTANGLSSLSKNTSGSNNSAFGGESLFNNLVGNFNSVFGFQAGYSSTGSKNTLVGYQAGSGITSGSNNIALGANTQILSSTGSNQLNIGNLIYGTGLLGGLAGNIGIGVSNPSYKLDVAGTGSFNAIRIYTGAAITAGSVLMSDASGNGTWQANPSSALEWTRGGNTIGASSSILGTKDNKDLIIMTNSGEKLRVLTDGNLSLSGMTIGRGNNYIIGNTVLGANALASANSSMNAINNTAIGSGALKTVNVGFNNTAVGYNSLGGVTSGDNNIGIGFSAGSQISSGNNNIAIGSGVQVSNGTLDNQLNIGNWIYGSGGNIGIGSGVTVPGSTLTLSGTFQYRHPSAGTGYVLTSSDGIGGATWTLVSGSNAWDRSGNTGAIGEYIGTKTGYPFRMFSSGSERMRIEPNGTVGIGIISPLSAYLLHVNGSTYLNNTHVASGAQITFLAPATNGTGGLSWLFTGSTTDFASINAIQKAVDQTDLTFTVGNDGRSSITDRFVFKINDPVPANVAYPMTLASTFANFYSGAIYVDSSNTNNLQIGIGTDTPTQRLDVAGIIRIRGSGTTIVPGMVLVASGADGSAEWKSLNSASGVLNSWTIAGNTGTVTEYIGTNDSRDFIIKTNQVERLRVVENGNLQGSLILSGMTIGRGSGYVVGNTALGVSALSSVTSGGNNTAIGLNSLSANTNGASNTAIGIESLMKNTSGGNNVAQGMRALFSNTTGTFNTAIGNHALSGSTGNNNTALGGYAGSGITSGSNNIAIGYNAQVPSPTYGSQLSIGNWIYGSGGNIGIGTSTPTQRLTISGGTLQLITGTQGVDKYLRSDANGIASWTGLVITTEWTRQGNDISSSTTDFLGTTSNHDLVIKTNGAERLRVGTGGSLFLSGMTIGRGNGYVVGNTALGVSALSVTTGGNNTAIGSGALKSNLGGTGNTANGVSALFSNTTGTNNTANGLNALFSNVGGINNVAIGYQSLYSNTASNNTALGYMAGSGISIGANNTLLGALAGTTITAGTNNIAIGYGAQVPNGASNDQLSIGNWIYGSGGNIGIGTNNPSSTLTVSGSLQLIDGSQGSGKYLVSDANGVASWKSKITGTGTYIYRMSSSSSTVNGTTLQSIPIFTTAPLPIGAYQFEFIGKFDSNNPGNGIGITLAEDATADTINFIATVSAPLTTSTMYQSSFNTAGTPVITSGVPASFTDYPILMNGVFEVTNTGSMMIQYRAGVGGGTINMKLGSTLIIRSLNPALFVTGT